MSFMLQLINHLISSVKFTTQALNPLITFTVVHPSVCLHIHTTETPINIFPKCTCKCLWLLSSVSECHTRFQCVHHFAAPCSTSCRQTEHFSKNKLYRVDVRVSIKNVSLQSTDTNLQWEVAWCNSEIRPPRNSSSVEISREAETCSSWAPPQGGGVTLPWLWFQLSQWQKNPIILQFWHWVSLFFFYFT